MFLFAMFLADASVAFADSLQGAEGDEPIVHNAARAIFWIFQQRFGGGGFFGAHLAQ